MNNIIKLIKKTFLVLLIFIIPNYNNAKEILVYADSITYDDEENLIARGKFNKSYPVKIK